MYALILKMSRFFGFLLSCINRNKMNKEILQRVIFIIATICACFTPILDGLPWFRFTMFIAAVTYLGMSWSFTMIRNDYGLLVNEMVGFFYATVFFGNFMATSGLPFGRIIAYLGYAMTVILMIYMLINHKKVRKDMTVQSIVLFYIAVIPLLFT
jgi:hypothetical protein